MPGTVKGSNENSSDPALTRAADQVESTTLACLSRVKPAMARLNKKILCFVDEYGTAGEPGFALGCVIVWARECGRLDKTFSDLLPASVNEVHAADWEKEVVQGLLARLAGGGAASRCVMLNCSGGNFSGKPAIVYALALVETVKIGIRRFQRLNRVRIPIGNVEVIVDACEQNTSSEFDTVIKTAREQDGMFRAVNRVIPLDSAASRVLQLADVVAHSRSWIVKGEKTAQKLKDVFGIEMP